MNEADKRVQDINDFFEEEEDFGKLLEAYDKSKGEAIFEGKIIALRDDEVDVDIGKKSEGILARDEILDGDANLLFDVGDVIKVAIVGSRGGRALVSHKKALRKEKVAEFIKNYNEESRDVFEVKIVSKNKGGLVVVDDSGVEFFLPKSQYGFKDLSHITDKGFKVKIIKVDKEEQSIIVSRRKILDDERKKRKEILGEILERDGLIEGVVKKITSYGMFVDVGGVDGLVHYSEISYKGPVNPSTLYKEGDGVTVKIINYDREKKHLSLSIKAALPDPWDKIKENLEVGDTVRSVVSNIEPYGAFVDLGNDIEGFLHISEISWDKNIKNPKDYISKGQEIDVEIIEINTDERRLRVSLRNLLSKPFDAFFNTHKVGDVVEGVITSITAFGAFVKISNVEGLLHNEDASWDRANKCKDLFKSGESIRVKIVRIDKDNQKISLSAKELESSPVQAYAKTCKVNDIVRGTVRDIKDFGVFVKLSDTVDALIHREDISAFMLEGLKVGDEIEAAITLIDANKNKIRLSVKNLVRLKEKEVLNEINSNDKITLGDIIKEQLS